MVVIDGRQWTVDVATTIQELTAGLSGVASIPPNTGMLFDVGVEQVITVNAQLMLFPIDVIFISKDRVVTEVAYNLVPGDSGTAGLPARYFLEVNAGEAVGVEDGDLANIQITDGGVVIVDMNSLLVMMVTMMMVVMMMKAMTGIMEQPRPAALKPVKVPPGYVPVGFVR